MKNELRNKLMSMKSLAQSNGGVSKVYLGGKDLLKS